MYSRAIPILGGCCVATIALYLLGVAATVFFATWQTGLARAIQETEGAVITLEGQYYDAVQTYSDIEPASVGYVSPRSVGYVTPAGVAVLSRAQ